MTIVLLSGPSGSGKTTTVEALEALATRSGITVGGVACVAAYEDGEKRGIAWRRVGRNVSSTRLAWVAAERREAGRPLGEAPRRVPRLEDGSLRFGMWRFDPEALAEADEAARGCIHGSPAEAGSRRLCLIDEIGPLELDWDLGFVSTLEALDASRGAGDSAGGVEDGYPAACVVTARPEIADRLESRWSGSLRVDLTRSAEPESRNAVRARALTAAEGILRVSGLA